MRVLIADKLAAQAVERLRAAGFQVRVEPTAKGSELSQIMADFHPQVLVVRSTKVQAEQLAATQQLALVVRAGAGVNTIDVSGCTAGGVHVANCPGKNAVAVAELTIGLLLAIDRRIVDNTVALRNHQWNKTLFSKAQGIRGRTLGVVGLGAIGSEVARLGQALGMTVLGWSERLTKERAKRLGVTRCETLAQLAKQSSVVSVHLALTPKTRGLIGSQVFDELAAGEIVINTSRAEVVDTAALVAALDRGVLAGLDVFDGEPASGQAPFTHGVASHPGVVGTHHIGASTTQAQLAVAQEACRVIETFQATGQVLNGVNPGS